MVQKSTLIYNISKECGRNILFQSAVYWAEEGCKVLYIARMKFDRIPLTAHGPKIPSAEVLAKIRIVYLDSIDEFLKFIIDVVTFRDSVPRVILVENLDTFISDCMDSRDFDHSISRACAVLHHVSASCAAQSKLLVHLLVTFTKPVPPIICSMFNYVWAFTSEDNTLTKVLPRTLLGTQLKMTNRLDGAFVLSEVNQLFPNR